MNTPMRRCTKCGNEYPATIEFFKRKRNGLESKCRTCLNAWRREYRAEHPERQHEEYLRNRDKKQEYQRQYRIDHAEQRREYNRRYYREHKEEKTVYWREYNARTRYAAQKRYRQNHPDRIRAQHQRFYAANPAKYQVYVRTRRARIKQAQGTHTPQDIERQIKSQKGLCYYCGKQLIQYHVDHIVPITRGGSNDPSNLVITCPKCNRKKSNKLPHEWPDGGRLL